MIDIIKKEGYLSHVKLNGTLIGYVSETVGASVGVIVEKDDISKSDLAKVFRALDKRDGGQFPERYACCLGFNIYAKDLVKYGD